MQDHPTPERKSTKKAPLKETLLAETQKTALLLQRLFLTQKLSAFCEAEARRLRLSLSSDPLLPSLGATVLPSVRVSRAYKTAIDRLILSHPDLAPEIETTLTENETESISYRLDLSLPTLARLSSLLPSALAALSPFLDHLQEKE